MQLTINTEHLNAIEKYLQLTFNQTNRISENHVIIKTNAFHFYSLLSRMNEELIEADLLNAYTIPSNGINDGGIEYNDDEMQLIRSEEMIDKIRLIDQTPEPNQCSNCICCMNKEFNPFCIERNKSVQLNETCINHERND